MYKKRTDGPYYHSLVSVEEERSFIGKHYKVTGRQITISNEAIAKRKWHLNITVTMLYPGPFTHFRNLRWQNYFNNFN